MGRRVVDLNEKLGGRVRDAITCFQDYPKVPSTPVNFVPQNIQSVGRANGVIHSGGSKKVLLR